ncbi:DUF6864 domain-containing function [uncultured Succiniclasticum sp.]|uniref:DUF6864 domain-containing function n=1 Tax=uncultured Succiniclasticum sp. TaxID=1500547 RepID=UPI0025F54E6E|nr:hypothetical protein [uncultured Succiniclasticum sp.]
MKVSIQKKSSVYDIVDSGTAFNYLNDDSVKLDIELNGEFAFSIEFLFPKGDKGKSDLKVDYDSTKKLIKFACFGFDNSLGTGTKQPIEIGIFNGKKLFIHFWIYSLGESQVKKLEYCFFMERQ